MIINSSHNAKVKKLRALKTKKGRDEYNLFCIEGVNILKDLNADAEIEELYIKQSAYERLSYLEDNLKCKAELISDSIFDSVCDTKSPNGAIAVAKIPDYQEAEGDTIILLCGISDAGNMGTIFRTAAARGIKTALLYGDCVDVFSPKVIRAGMGAVFYVKSKKTNDEELNVLLKEYSLTGLDSNGESIYQYKRKPKMILAVGSEAHGLPPSIRNKCDDIVSLPMEGKIESLNAAISISVALYMLNKEY